MSTRQTFSEAEIAQIQRIARPVATEEAKAAADKLCADAFVGGDKSPVEACALHRTMQKRAIDRENKWSERLEKVLVGAMSWGALGLLAIGMQALWAAFKNGVKQ